MHADTMTNPQRMSTLSLNNNSAVPIDAIGKGSKAMKHFSYRKIIVALLYASFVTFSTISSAEKSHKEIVVVTIEENGVKELNITVNSSTAKEKGHKYELDLEYQTKIAVRPEVDIDTDYIALDATGNLILRKGFSWNGANGTIDTKTILRGSMVHDALYQLMREGEIESSQWRKIADDELRRICREDGMGRARLAIMHFVFRIYGEKSTKENTNRSEKKIFFTSNHGR